MLREDIRYLNCISVVSCHFTLILFNRGEQRNEEYWKNGNGIGVICLDFVRLRPGCNTHGCPRCTGDFCPRCAGDFRSRCAGNFRSRCAGNFCPRCKPGARTLGGLVVGRTGSPWSTEMDG